MKKTTMCLSAFMLVGLIVSTGFVSAFRAGFGSGERRLAIRQAIEENNFDAWRAAMLETLTQENFDRLVERHGAIAERRELRSAVRQAIEDGNYEAYKEAVENLMSSYEAMNEDDFNAMVERYNARGSGEGSGPMGGFDCPRRGFGRRHIPW